MGVMNFQIPGKLSAETAEGLRRAHQAGGYDHSPVPTQIELKEEQLVVRRDSDESGFFFAAPWEIPDVGRLFGTTSTLMERPTPYRLLVELARGKVNQLRSQAFEWQFNGFEFTPAITEQIQAATRAFGQSVRETDASVANEHAARTLGLAYSAAENLVASYVNQRFAQRRAQPEKTDPLLACRVTDIPTGSHAEAFRRTFNSVCVPMTWRSLEPIEANYQWEATDRVLTWALDHQYQVTAGPLIDFTRRGVPEWLHTWEGDLPSLASFMCDYLETTIARYKNRIRRWVIASGSNNSLALGLSEDDLIRLTARLAEAAWGVDATLEVVVGLAQPWGEYLTGDYFNYSPFVFADTLMRAGLPLSGFELEWHMGAGPRGMYCRDLLDASRLLDMFGMLGAPLQLSLCYPSSVNRDPNADPEAAVGRTGVWHGLTPDAQAKWAENFTALGLAKPFVSSTCWDHFSDIQPHRFPQGGLIDLSGNAKPSLERLRFVRETHLRSTSSTMMS